MRSLKKVVIAMGLYAMLSVAGCTAQGKPAAAVRMASPPEVSAAHTAAGQSVLPEGARDVHFDDAQSVTVDGSPQLTVLPVRFKALMKDPVIEGQTLSLCGIVVLPQGGTPTLVETLGTGNTEMMSCAGLKAVGGTAALKPGNRPDLILIYDAYTGRDSQAATILLTWNASGNTYAVDDALSQWLGEQKDGRTVSGARRLLANKRKAKSGNS